MTDTKEQILMTALHLFARDGYEAVSVRTIAEALGMTKGALYKHYRNKRDIFDHIVERMFQIDAQRAQNYDVPEQTYEAAPSQYQCRELCHIKSFTMAQLFFWTADDFASSFRRMLSLERYRNPEMGKLYSDCITEGPVSYMEDIFREMMAEGVLKEADPKQLAVEYYAPLYLLIQMWDGSVDRETLTKLLENHIDRFVQANTGKELVK